MRVSEVHAGMHGHGLSVFFGTKIDRFDVEVISVLHNFNPKYDVILIKCAGANLEHSGAIAGMSGSPIYLIDDSGHEKLAGAFAYGWPLVKDPIAGVQPIEYMLEVGASLRPEASATQESRQLHAPINHPASYIVDPRRSIFSNQSAAQTASAHPMLGDDSPALVPLATPLMASGLSPRMLEKFAPILKQYGLIALQAGGSSGATTQPDIAIEPGSVLAAPLLTGDVDMTAIGTCTEVIGDRVFGFGHPFNNEGPITLPMASGSINGIVNSLQQSFKLGSMSQLRGTLIADQSVGVMGKLGKAPPTIPIDLRVLYTDGSSDTSYHFDAAAHPRLTPALGAMAVTAAMSGQRDLPQYHTVAYDITLDFANGQSVRLNNVAVNDADQEVTQDISAPITLASENPFERVLLKKISGTIRVTSEAHDADILSVDVPKSKYRPGETLQANVRYRPFRSGEAIMPIELELPHDLSDGSYQLQVSDQPTYISSELSTHTFRFSAESIDDLFAVLKDAGGIRADALYVQLVRAQDGLAVGRTAMPMLPSSQRQVLLDAGRSNISSFVSTADKIIPTEMVMNGSANFQIEIDSQQRVDVNGVSKPAKNEPHAAGGSAEPSKPKAAAPIVPKHDAPPSGPKGGEQP